MADRDEMFPQLRDLLAAQRLAVLATHNDGQPHGSLIAFAASDDLTRIVFATPRSTRKYANLSADGRVALLIDSRTALAADLRDTAAVTITGRVSEVEPKEGSPALVAYVARHPALAEFVADAGCALMEVAVEAYRLVDRFQRVRELRLS